MVKVTINGTPKEIAALVLAVQERQPEVTVSLDGLKCDAADLLETIDKINKMSASKYLSQRKTVMDSVKDH